MNSILCEFLDLELNASVNLILKKIHLKRLKTDLPEFVEGYLEKKIFDFSTNSFG